MTYNVFGGTLNPTLLLYSTLAIWTKISFFLQSRSCVMLLSKYVNLSTFYTVSQKTGHTYAS